MFGGRGHVAKFGDRGGVRRRAKSQSRAGIGFEARTGLPAIRIGLTARARKMFFSRLVTSESLTESQKRSTLELSRVWGVEMCAHRICIDILYHRC